MANPLTLYVPIKQDTETQGNAVKANAAFAMLVKNGLNATNNVHYARMALIPNVDPKPDGPQHHAILLMTEFDQDMTTYLDVFWDEPSGGVKAAFQGVASMALDAPDDPTDHDQFINFIVDNNLNKNPSNSYSAYPQTVNEILQKFPRKP